MTKNEFMSKLEMLLAKLDKNERDKTLSYYNEMIDDLIEDGATEEVAIERVGTPGQIAELILSDEIEATKQKKKINILSLTLIVLGFPFWGVLVLVALAFLLVIFLMALTCYIMIWLIPFLFGAFAFAFVILSLVSTFGSFAIMSFNMPLGLIQFGLGVGSMGLFILASIGTVYLCKIFKVATVKFTQFINEHIIKRMRGIKLWQA